MTTTATKDRPIIFSGEMVRAILDGRKTQTRRAINPQPTCDAAHVLWSEGRGHSGQGWYASDSEYPEEGSEFWTCPYGKPGTLLSVREEFTAHWCQPPVALVPEKIVTSGEIPQKTGTCAHPTPEDPLFIYYRATFGDDPPMFHMRWEVAADMERYASRITLEVSEVRVQRVQDISLSDAISEGNVYAGGGESKEFMERNSPRHCFTYHWDRDHLPLHWCWDVNPWVWAITFKRVESADA